MTPSDPSELISDTRASSPQGRALSFPGSAAHTRGQEMLLSDFVERRHLRLAVYSHDTMGIGHLRRNLLITQALMDGLRPALERSVASGRPAVLHVDVDPVDHLWAPGLDVFKAMHLEPGA